MDRTPSPTPAWLGMLMMLLSPVARGGEIEESGSSFTSQGKTVHIEVFAPKGAGTYPGILVLHGAGGMRPEGFGFAFREYARQLARAGYVAHIVHYFDRTGHEVATDEAMMKENFADWMKTVGDGVTHLAAAPNVDGDRIGLLGFSLGAYLSLSEAMFDPRISAVVEYFGGLPEALAKDLKRLPPVLILHGAADRVVPVKEAETLERLFTQKKIVYEKKIYPRQGHGFLGEDGADAVKRAMAFLDKHVKRTEASRNSD
jgi:dienelactone hydrolase